MFGKILSRGFGKIPTRYFPQTHRPGVGTFSIVEINQLEKSFEAMCAILCVNTPYAKCLYMHISHRKPRTQ